MTAQIILEPDGLEIPAFLRRQPKGATPMPEAPIQPTTATTKRPKRKMRDAYMATARICIPLDMSDPQSFAVAAEAIKKLGSGLPEGSTFESEARIGKIEAA